MRKLQKGDTIKCKNKLDMIDTMMKLSRNGVETDWPWIAEDSERKYTLLVTEVDE